MQILLEKSSRVEAYVGQGINAVKIDISPTTMIPILRCL